jgi:hypothetical protein
MGIAEETGKGTVRNLGNQLPTETYPTSIGPGGDPWPYSSPGPSGSATEPKPTTSSGQSGGGVQSGGGQNTPGASPGIVKTDTATNTVAVAQLVGTWAQSVGLGSLAGWITSQVQALAGEGLAASDIASVIESTINTAPGFDALMPGYNKRIQNGYTNTDASSGAGIAGYLAYRQQINAMAETAGLVPGTISAQDVGNAWANDVSTSEMSTRLTTEYTNAINAMPQIQNELKNYGYVNGLTPGQLASYYINPDQTVNTLQQQFNSAQVGGEGVLTGFGEIGQSKAYALQAFLSNGGQNPLSAAQSANFFDQSLGNGLNSLSMMSQSGFTNPQVGAPANGPGVVNQDQLIAAGEGNAQALQTVQRAAQTRAAVANGGGGLSASQSGVQGVGFGAQ